MHYQSASIFLEDTYICLPEGEPYVVGAYKRGAKDIRYLTRPDFALESKKQFCSPDSELQVIGVTGTNGKTSVVFFINQLLNFLGKKSVYSGTLKSALTTPESFDTYQLMRSHVDKGGDVFVMEVSSHAIDQFRVYGMKFDVKVLTNITQDHLDYHPSFEQYKYTKLSFFNEGDSKKIMGESCGFLPIETPLLGSFHHSNLCVAIHAVMALGFTQKACLSFIPLIEAPPGRFDPIVEGQPFRVIIDYAHTPDALSSLLQSVARLKGPEGKVITVFGCGGNRDKGKRPLMAMAANKYSDFVLVTEDNPRTESSACIFKDILKGFFSMEGVSVVQNREGAIEMALKMATDKDIVVIAGKGHECTQIIGDESFVFNDKQVATRVIKELYESIN